MKHHHLKVVDSGESSDGETGRKSRLRSGETMAPLGYQMPLPLENESDSKKIVVVAMDDVHGTQFCSLVINLKPRTVVDVRHLIRFDLPGTSRKEVFSCFGAVHALYVNASLPWHELQPRDFISEDGTLSQRLSHEVIEREDSPILLLASKEPNARFLASYLHRVLSSQATCPWKIEQAV